MDFAGRLSDATMKVTISVMPVIYWPFVRVVVAVVSRIAM